MLYAKLRSKLLCIRTYVGANVQVNFSHFRLFDAAYERSVLRVYVHTYLLGVAISAEIHTEFLPRLVLRDIVWKITAESCGKFEHVHVDICTHLHRKI